MWLNLGGMLTAVTSSYIPHILIDSVKAYIAELREIREVVLAVFKENLMGSSVQRRTDQDTPQDLFLHYKICTHIGIVA